mgnify:CR=1 FL=1
MTACPSQVSCLYQSPLGQLKLVEKHGFLTQSDFIDELSEEETIEVVVSVVKARRESLDYAVKGNRSDLVLQAEQELQILADYLPQQLSEEEVQDIVQRAIRETGAESPKDMGRVMGIIMPQVKGRADGKLVNNLVRQYLG